MEAVPNTLSTISTFTFHRFFFKSQVSSMYLRLFSLSLKSTIWHIIFYYLLFFFFCWISIGQVFWPTLGALSQNLRDFCLILWDEFLFLHIPLGSMVEFQFLAQFRVDHLPRPVVNSLVLLYYYYYLHLFNFFTLALADGFSLEFEWQQVYSSLQDASQYSGRCQWCSHLDAIHSSSYFQVLQSLY